MDIVALQLSDIVNDNSISAIAAGCFASILACLGLALKWVHKTLKAAVSAKEEATDAKEEAAIARAKIEPVSNGFAKATGDQLKLILGEVIDLRRDLSDHITWHMQKESDKNG